MGFKHGFQGLPLLGVGGNLYDIQYWEKQPCLYSKGEAINPTNLKLVAKYAFQQALRNLKSRLAGSRGFKDQVDGMDGWLS